MSGIIIEHFLYMLTMSTKIKAHSAVYKQQGGFNINVIYFKSIGTSDANLYQRAVCDRGG